MFWDWLKTARLDLDGDARAFNPMDWYFHLDQMGRWQLRSGCLGAAENLWLPHAQS